jgi:hypothetical protein
VQNQLEQRIVQVLCEEWEQVRPGILESEAIYDRLAGEGEHIPEGVMDDVLSRLRERGLIRGALPLGREAIRRHGAMSISHVEPHLCRGGEW